MGLKPDLQGGTGFNLLRVQFWTPVQRKRVSKGVRKWTPLKSKVVQGGSSFGPFIVANLLKRLFQVKSKVVPPGGSSFGPFIVANLLKRLFQVEADLTSNSCEWKLELEALSQLGVGLMRSYIGTAQLKKVLGWA